MARNRSKRGSHKSKGSPDSDTEDHPPKIPEPKTPEPKTPLPRTPKLEAPEVASRDTLPMLSPNRPTASPISCSLVPQGDILGHKIRKMLSTQSVEHIAEPIRAYAREKRNLSELSAISSRSPLHEKIQKTEGETETGEEMVEADMAGSLRLMRQKITTVDRAYEAKQATLKRLIIDFREGSTDTKQGDFDEEVERLEKEIGDLLVSRTTMRTSLCEFAGRDVDVDRWNKRAHADDWAYLDLLLARQREPSGSTVTTRQDRDINRQARWRKELLAAYGAQFEGGGYVWCPITRCWAMESCVTAAHIVRHDVTELAAEHLFGPAPTASGHIWSPRNGIPMISIYEKLLDDAQIAIIPTADEANLMVVVLDERELAEKNPAPPGPVMVHVVRGKELDGRILEFKNDHRPAKRYLYFNFAMSILRRQRYAVEGWWRDRIRLTKTPFFASPGRWTNETTLRRLAVRIGHLTADEAERFVDIMAGPPQDREEDPFVEQDAERADVLDSVVEHAYQLNI